MIFALMQNSNIFIALLIHKFIQDTSKLKLKLRNMTYDNESAEDEEDCMNDEQSRIMKLRKMFKKLYVRRNNGKLNYVVAARLQILNIYHIILTFRHVGTVHMIYNENRIAFKKFFKYVLRK